MPMDDALKMVARTFVQMRQEKRGLGGAGNTPIDREIHFILGLLMNGKYLTIPELDRVLNYVQDLRDSQAIAENIPVSSNRPATSSTSDSLKKSSGKRYIFGLGTSLSPSRIKHSSFCFTLAYGGNNQKCYLIIGDKLVYKFLNYC